MALFNDSEYPSSDYRTIPGNRAGFCLQRFSRMDDPEQRKSFGASITLEAALRLKGLDRKVFNNLLETAIHGRADLQEEGIRDGKDSALQITGLLPCPVRLRFWNSSLLSSTTSPGKTG